MAKGRRVKVPSEQWRFIFEDESLRVLPDELFYAVKERLETNRELSQRHTKYDYTPARGFVFCPVCNNKKLKPIPMYGVPYFACRVCRKPMFLCSQIWNDVKDNMSALLLDPDRLVAGVREFVRKGHNASQLQDEISLAESRLQVLDGAETKFMRLYGYGDRYPQEKLDAELVQIKVNQSRLKADLENLHRELQETRQASVDKAGLRHFCRLAEENISNLTDKQWALILTVLKVRIMPVDKGFIHVQMRVPSIQQGVVLQPSVLRQ